MGTSNCQFLSGVSTCQLISVTNPEWFEDFKDKTKRKSQKRINKEEYFNLKNTIGEMMIEQLIKMFPDVAKEVIRLNLQE